MMDKRVRAVLVTSGKGGVGKSMTAVNLAVHLADSGLKTGLLDADTRAPNDTYLLGMEELIESPLEHPDRKITPPVVPNHPNLRVWSSAFLFNNRRANLFPGEMVRSFLEQSVNDLDWGKDLEILVVDMDPSSGDSMQEMVNMFGTRRPILRAKCRRLAAVIVSTADISSLNDCQRMMHACRRFDIPIVGVIGNMIGSECPGHGGPIVCRDCGYVVDFGGDGFVKKLANGFAAPYAGTIPWNPSLLTTPGKTGIHPEVALFRAVADSIRVGAFW